MGEGKASPDRKRGQINGSSHDSRGDSSSPERTGKTKQRHPADATELMNTSGGSRQKRSRDKTSLKDERKATSYLLQ